MIDFSKTKLDNDILSQNLKNFTIEEIYNGDEENDIDDAERRQDKLIGITVEAAMRVAAKHICEDYKSDPEKLIDKLYSKQLIQIDGKTAEAQAKVITKLESYLKHTEDAFGIIEPYLSPPDVLFDNEDFTNYNERIREFKHQMDKFSQEVEYFRATSGSQGKIKIPDVIFPIHPAIKNFNERFSDVITIHETGPKHRESAQRKATEGGQMDTSSFKDINRITVIPKEYQYAQDFNQELGMLVGKDKIMAGRFKIRASGNWDAKTRFILQKGRNGKFIPAEIKILSAEMQRANFKSDKIYKIMRLFENGKTGAHVDKITADNYDNICRYYEEFMQEAKKISKDSPILHDISDIIEEINPPKTFEAFEKDPRFSNAMYHNLNQIHQIFVIEKVLNMDSEWKVQYLATAELKKQELEKENPKALEKFIKPELIGYIKNSLPEYFQNKIPEEMEKIIANDNEQQSAGKSAAR